MCWLSGLTTKSSGIKREKSICTRRFSVTLRCRGGLPQPDAVAQQSNVQNIARRVVSVLMRPSSVCARLELKRWRPGRDRDFDHCRLPGRERLLQGRVEMFRVGAQALGTEYARHFGKAGIVQGGTDLAPLETRALIVLRG